MTTHGIERVKRGTFSLSKAQVTWLFSLLEMLRRGADVGVLMRSEESAGVFRLIRSAKMRVDGVPYSAFSPPRPRCWRGLHEYTPENTYRKSNGKRQCRACMLTRQKRRLLKKKQMRSVA